MYSTSSCKPRHLSLIPVPDAWRAVCFLSYSTGPCVHVVTWPHCRNFSVGVTMAFIVSTSTSAQREHCSPFEMILIGFLSPQPTQPRLPLILASLKICFLREPHVAHTSDYVLKTRFKIIIIIILLSLCVLLSISVYVCASQHVWYPWRSERALDGQELKL